MDRPIAIAQDARTRHSALSDEEVVVRVRAGDPGLYEILMRRHNQRLYRAVRAILRDDSEVEDVLQDAYLAAYRNLGSFEVRARFSTWLTRIAVNRALDRRRRRARMVLVDPQEEAAALNRHEPPTSSPGAGDPEQESARHELRHLLEHAIDALPARYRGVYVLREVEGMSTQEAAECLGIEANTVKTRLHRARGLLRARLTREFGDVAVAAFPFGAQRCDRLVAWVLALLEPRTS